MLDHLRGFEAKTGGGFFALPNVILPRNSVCWSTQTRVVACPGAPTLKSAQAPNCRTSVWCQVVAHHSQIMPRRGPSLRSFNLLLTSPGSPLAHAVWGGVHV